MLRLALMAALAPAALAILCSHTTCHISYGADGGNLLKVYHSRVEKLCARYEQTTPLQLLFKHHGKRAKKQCALSELTGKCECHLFGTHPYSHFRRYESLTSLRVTVELSGLRVAMFSAAVRRGVASAFALELRVPPQHISIRDVREVRRARRLGKLPAADDDDGSGGAGEGESEGEREVALEARDSVVFDVYVESWTGRAQEARSILEGAKVDNTVQSRFAHTLKQEIVDAVQNSGGAVSALRAVRAAFGAVVVLEKVAGSDELNCAAGSVATKDCGEHVPGTRIVATTAASLSPITVTLEACIRTCELTNACTAWSFRRGGSLHTPISSGECFLLDKKHASDMVSTSTPRFRSAVCTESNAVCAACPNAWAVSAWHGAPAQSCEVKACDKTAGAFLNARENRCERCANAFVVARWADSGTFCEIAACAGGYYLSDARCMRCRNKHKVARWAPGLECTISACRAGWYADVFLNKCSPSRIQWKTVFARGTAGNIDVGSSEFQALVLQSPSRMVKRVCADCDDDFKIIIYKRISEPSAVQFYDLFHKSFTSKHNKLHVDFELYSSEADAKAGVNGWSWCNYDHGEKGFGFPRDCGKQGRARKQWNSLVRQGNARRNYAFYVDAGDAIGERLAPPALEWTKVFARSASHGSSLKTCGELGWTTRHGSDDRVCAASHCQGALAQGQKHDSKRPPLATTFDDAQAMCRSEGARLCTLAELEAHETAGTGCGHDGRRVWSSTECGFGQSFTQFGRSLYGALQSNCENHRSTSGHVRCCADASTNADIGAAAFQAAVERSQYKMIKRTCSDCSPEYRQVIYMRTGVDYHDYYDLFHHAWVRRDNMLHRDFELFSSDADALAHRKTWGFCNYAPDNRNGIGFPRECGATGKVQFQWNSLTKTAASRKEYAFFVSN